MPEGGLQDQGLGRTAESWRMFRGLIAAQRLLDGAGSALLENAAVLVRGDGIQWVGAAALAPAGPGEDRLDLGDVTLLPGLIGMHTHLRINHAEGDLPVQMRDPDVPYVLRGLGNLERNLRSGVTTMKLNGDRAFFDVQMRDAIRSGLTQGPRLFVAGKGIKSSRCTGGVVATAICDGPEAIRTAVRENVGAGADLISMRSRRRCPGGTPGGSPAHCHGPGRGGPGTCRRSRVREARRVRRPDRREGESAEFALQPGSRPVGHAGRPGRVCPGECLPDSGSLSRRLDS